MPRWQQQHQPFAVTLDDPFEMVRDLLVVFCGPVAGKRELCELNEAFGRLLPPQQFLRYLALREGQR